MSLKDDLKKLYGLPPYNTPTNMVYGDGYFARSLKNKYGEEAVNKAKKELGIK